MGFGDAFKKFIGADKPRTDRTAGVNQRRAYDIGLDEWRRGGRDIAKLPTEYMFQGRAYKYNQQLLDSALTQEDKAEIARQEEVAKARIGQRTGILSAVEGQSDPKKTARRVQNSILNSKDASKLSILG